MKRTAAVMLLLYVALFVAVTVEAQTQTPAAPPPPPPAYGSPITLDQAKKVLAAAEAEAKKNNWNVVISIVDTGGQLVTMSRLDNTQFGSVEVAREKAYSSVAFRRPTKVFQDSIAKGGENIRLLGLTGASLLEGGIPIVVDGKIVGGIGVSGVTSAQDAQIAQAGIDALKK
jgi:glc operon protein GlcG